MQIREITLSELDLAYEIFKYSNKNITYKEYEDIIYQAVKENYKIILAIINNKPLAYAAIRIQTNIEYKKHIIIDEIIIKNDENKIDNYNELVFYLKDYAKMNQCHEIIVNKIYNIEIRKIKNIELIERRYKIL
jgi:hypothetical protein